jgi:hypothetical protein
MTFCPWQIINSHLVVCSRALFFMENLGQIIRSKKTGKSRYTPVNNEILQSLTLTAEEKSILVHLLSLPEDWVVYKMAFGKSLNMGRHRFNNAWKGLQQKGYIVSVQMIDTNTNLMRGWNHMVHEEPVLNEQRIDQSTELPKIGQSDNRVLYKEIIKEQSNNLTKELCDFDSQKEKEETTAPPPKRIYPTLEECVDWFIQNQFNQKEAAAFFHYWESMNWTRKGGAKIQKWKSAASQWIAKLEPPSTNQTTQPTMKRFNIADYE